VYLYVDGILAGPGDLPANVGIEAQPVEHDDVARKCERSY
jgi:2-keto-3-deoxy-L-rhamnonate aldolase RhmA